MGYSFHIVVEARDEVTQKCLVRIIGIKGDATENGVHLISPMNIVRHINLANNFERPAHKYCEHVLLSKPKHFKPKKLSKRNFFMHLITLKTINCQKEILEDSWSLLKALCTIGDYTVCSNM